MTTQLLDGAVADRQKSEPARKSRSVWPSNPAVALWITMVGKKVVMAVSGIVLVGFVIAHMLGNLKIFLGVPPHDGRAAVSLQRAAVGRSDHPPLLRRPPTSPPPSS